MWHWSYFWHMRFGFPPFGFFFYGPGKFPSREEYLRMLEEYKRELEEELREVERQIEEMKRSK